VRDEYMYNRDESDEQAAGYSNLPKWIIHEDGPTTRLTRRGRDGL
jgi:hypothetical protein